MTRHLPLAVLLLATACNQQDQATPPERTAAEAPKLPAPVERAEIPSLAGQWRVTAPAAADLSFNKGTASLSSGCVRRGFTYTQTGNQVSFTSAPAGSANCGGTPSGGVETVAAALADANLAVFGKDGRTVSLSGLGGMVALERR